MRAALFYGGTDIRVEDVPTPEPGPGEGEFSGVGRSVELGEDTWNILCGDADTGIGDGEDEVVSGACERDGDRAVLGSIAYGVRDEVACHPFEHVEASVDVRKVGVGGNRHGDVLFFRLIPVHLYDSGYNRQQIEGFADFNHVIERRYMREREQIADETHDIPGPVGDALQDLPDFRDHAVPIYRQGGGRKGFDGPDRALDIV